MESLLTIRDVAATLRLSQRAVWSMLSSGRFGPEVIRLGRSVRIRSGELSDWVLAGCPNRVDWQAQRGEAVP
ncbi:MAG: helix-turn-helix domain-containing protein [Planctomycetes bacterium]|nr:helix-turn-helix domain-containing protein [Planctomycetota bacterium]